MRKRKKSDLCLISERFLFDLCVVQLTRICGSCGVLHRRKRTTRHLPSDGDIVFIAKITSGWASVRRDITQRNGTERNGTGHKTEKHNQNEPVFWGSGTVPQERKRNAAAWPVASPQQESLTHAKQRPKFYSAVASATRQRDAVCFAFRLSRIQKTSLGKEPQRGCEFHGIVSRSTPAPRYHL